MVLRPAIGAPSWERSSLRNLLPNWDAPASGFGLPNLDARAPGFGSGPSQCSPNSMRLLLPFGREPALQPEGGPPPCPEKQAGLIGGDVEPLTVFSSGRGVRRVDSVGAAGKAVYGESRVRSKSPSTQPRERAGFVTRLASAAGAASLRTME